jgi:hypothetical protein
VSERARERARARARKCRERERERERESERESERERERPRGGKQGAEEALPVSTVGLEALFIRTHDTSIQKRSGKNLISARASPVSSKKEE